MQKKPNFDPSPETHDPVTNPNGNQPINDPTEIPKDPCILPLPDKRMKCRGHYS